MAHFKSAIVFKTGEVVGLTTSDSHEDIIRYLGLEDNLPIDRRNWCRVEYRPSILAEPWNSKWKLTLDEACEVEWFSDMQDTVTEKMKSLVERQVITGRVARLQFGIFYLAPTAKVPDMQSCHIPYANKAELGHVHSSTLEYVNGLTIHSLVKSNVNSLVKCNINQTLDSVLNSIGEDTTCNVMTNAIIMNVAKTASINNLNYSAVNTCGGRLLHVDHSYINVMSSSGVIVKGSPLILEDQRTSKKRLVSVSYEEFERLTKLNVVLGERLLKLGGKLPRMRKIKSAPVLTGKSKFPTYDTEGSLAVCLMCRGTYGTVHSNWNCYNPATNAYDIP